MMLVSCTRIYLNNFFPRASLERSELGLCYVCVYAFLSLLLYNYIGSSWGWGYGEHGLGINGHADV